MMSMLACERVRPTISNRQNDGKAATHGGSLRSLNCWTAADLQLVEDSNYYNFLRTARMEAKMRSQYLSIPLFAEIQRRGEKAGLLEPYDVYLMVPPEIQLFLRSTELPSDLVDRRKGWALVTHAARGEWRILSGTAKEEFEDSFYSIIDWRENARGLHTPIDSFVGGKGTGLFKLVQAGCDVPPFYVVTTEAFKRIMRHNGIESEIGELFRDIQNGEDRRSLAGRCRELILSCTIPPRFEKAIAEVFPQLVTDRVAVRSSATVEDAEDASWAGRFESVLNVDANGLLDAIRTVWASLVSDRALDYASHVASQGDLDLLAYPWLSSCRQWFPRRRRGS